MSHTILLQAYAVLNRRHVDFYQNLLGFYVEVYYTLWQDGLRYNTFHFRVIIAVIVPFNDN